MGLPCEIAVRNRRYASRELHKGYGCLTRLLVLGAQVGLDFSDSLGWVDVAFGMFKTIHKIHFVFKLIDQLRDIYGLLFHVFDGFDLCHPSPAGWLRTIHELLVVGE